MNSTQTLKEGPATDLPHSHFLPLWCHLASFTFPFWVLSHAVLQLSWILRTAALIHQHLHHNRLKLPPQTTVSLPQRVRREIKLPSQGRVTSRDLCRTSLQIMNHQTTGCPRSAAPPSMQNSSSPNHRLKSSFPFSIRPQSPYQPLKKEPPWVTRQFSDHVAWMVRVLSSCLSPLPCPW